MRACCEIRSSNPRRTREDERVVSELFLVGIRPVSFGSGLSLMRATAFDGSKALFGGLDLLLNLGCHFP